MVKSLEDENERLKESRDALKAEVERLRTALVDIKYYCTHVERSTVYGAGEIAARALGEAGMSKK